MSRVGGKVPGAAPKSALPFQVLIGALISAGKAKTPKEARKLIEKMLSKLRAAGLTGPDAKAVISKFQKENGLPQTGKLDAKTVKALTEKGLLPEGGPGKTAPGKGDKAEPGKVAKPGTPGKGEANKPAGGETGRPGGAQGSAPPATGQPGKGAPGGGAPAKGAPPGNVSAGKGGESKAPAKGARPATPASVSKMDRGEKNAFKSFAGTRPGAAQPSTTQAREVKPGAIRPKNLEVREVTKRAVTDKPAGDDTPQQLLATLQQSGHGKAGARPSAQNMREALSAFQMQNALPATGKMDEATKQELVEQGVLTPDGQVQAPPAAEGAKEAQGATSERGEIVEDVPPPSPEAAAAAAEDAEPQVIYGLGDQDVGFDDEVGNAQSGDEDEDDDDRGHAQLKDDEEHEEGYYRVPALVVQVRAALNAIVRDDDRKGAPTYAWDVTIYKPGVYGKGQKATPMWHVGLAGVSPFDGVWAEAQAVLETKIASEEPDVLAPTLYEFRLALQRARARAAIA